jgi:septum formation protein
MRVAGHKAAVVAGRRPGRVVLGADTTVVVDGTMLGKPADADDAAAMLRRLRGRPHQVLTGVALAWQAPAPDDGVILAVSPPPTTTDGPPIDGSGMQLVSGMDATTVWFRDLSDAEIDWYVRSGEPMDKAGGYAIQGLASRFVSRIEGSYGTVVGLPVAQVVQLLDRVRFLR